MSETADDEYGPSARGPAVTTRSTAGTGFAFEDLVAADLLSQFLLDMPIEGISVPGTHILSQTRAAGWIIDDLVCVGTNADGEARRLAISCKSNLQVTGNGWPAEFISAAWDMWRGDDPFRRATDRIGLVTRGRHTGFDPIWSNLKAWCRDADPDVAIGRINAVENHRRVFESIRTPGMRNGQLPSDVDTIALIGSIELYPLDFQLVPSRSLGLAHHRCRMALVSEAIPEAELLWEALLQSAEAARLGNGINRLSDLLSALAPRFALKAHPSVSAAWTSLLALSADQRASAETRLPNGHAIARPHEAGRLVDALKNQFGCIVTGDSGAGKSALVSDALDQQFASATQIWLGPEALTAALSATKRQALGLNHEFGLVLERSPGSEKLLVLDSGERLDAASLVKLDAVLANLSLRFAAGDRSWRVVIISQLTGFEDQLRSVSTTATWPMVIVPLLSNAAVRTALASVASLVWISNDADVLPLLSNLRTLGWVIAAASSFHEGQGVALTSAAVVADRLWTRWTSGPAKAQLHRLLVRLAVRDAAFERSFAVSKLETGDLAAFDQRSGELPLTVNTRNRIEFQHDLASDWARYQRLKEIADDIPAWAALAPQPLWIAALRLFGQHLLDQPDQGRHSWDNAFAAISSAGNVEAGDLLLDALCLDQNLDRHLTERAELFFADDGKLLLRLFHRFLHVATVPSIPKDVAIGDGLRIYLEADMRFPIIARWAPMGRFLHHHAERVGALGAPIVAKLCKTWLTSLPATLGDQPMPLRDVMARVALETARTQQIMSIARRTWGWDGEQDKLIFTAALAGADDLPMEVATFALEMARRRPLAEPTQIRVDAIRAADRATLAAIAQEPRQRHRPTPPLFVSSREDLPPWPLGPEGRLLGAYRDAVLHANGLTPLMRADPEAASEVLLACIVDDQPTREYSRSLRLDDDLGIEFDQQSYPTNFWKSPFFVYLQIQPDAALAALKQLLDFAMERWTASAPRDAQIPSISVTTADGFERHFPGTEYQFGWSQHNSTSSGQLFCALDALERWLTLKADACEDLAPWCERLFALEGSTGVLGVLVNLGKYQPALFKGPLSPLVGLEHLYWWDAGRVTNVNFNFDAFHWSRQGDAIFNMARDWVLAPHRRTELRSVIGDLAAEDAGFAAHVIAATAAWEVPDSLKERLEQRILRSEFDPANRHPVLDEASGETVIRLVYPLDLQRDLLAYNAEANASLEPITLPHQCEKILAGSANLSEESSQYLADLLPDSVASLPEEGDRRRMVAAVAATLIARGGDWFREHPDVADKAHNVVRATIDLVAVKKESPSGADDFASDEALRFSAIGALYAALQAEDPRTWEHALATIISGRDRGALATLMRVAEHHRDQLGPAWHRLNFLLLLFAGLSRLSPRFGEEDQYVAGWNRWLARLRAQPIFGTDATIEIIDPADIARRVERLLERRRERLHPNRPFRLSGKARRFAGLSTHILESGYAWLLDHEAAEAIATIPENRRLIADLWTFEVWRMQGEAHEDSEEGDDAGGQDGEYDLPSHLGYAILRMAATIVMAAPADEPDPLWRAILAIGPNGYRAVEQFAAGWFLLLFKQPDPDRFMSIWREMLTAAFAADWPSTRRWYRGRAMLVKLLGLHAPIELSQATAIRARIPELIEFYRRWACSEMRGDEDEVASFCHFLTTDAGTTLRLEGMIWLNDALTRTERFYRGSTGNNVAEAIDTILTRNAADLLAQPLSRNAVIDIVAKLVRGQVATAMGLQRRIAALR